MLKQSDIKYISEKSSLKINQVEITVKLIEEGNTVPFISRYRKEATGNMDEVAVSLVKELFTYVEELNSRKETVLKSIDEQGKLSEELKKAVETTYSKTELEDIYLPFKPRKRTRATIAREKGLEPLADMISDFSNKTGLSEMAERFTDKEKDVEDEKQALKGAADIIAERFSEIADLRRVLRGFLAKKGQLEVKVLKEWKDKRSKFEQYYEFTESVQTIPSHRLLAVRRGEKEKVLSSKIKYDPEYLSEKYCSYAFDIKHIRADFLKEIFTDALKRLIMPSIESDVSAELKKRSDEEAVSVFARNLEKLLLAPPAGSMGVLAVDPGFRTGCKLAVLDDKGSLLDNTAIYPVEPRKDIKGSEEVVKKLLKKYSIKAVVIGNGTASRETEDFFRAFLPDSVILTVVSEAGASVYSASKAAREEFPDHDLTVRGAVSIGRRFMDPLAELVKIEPKSIGVGQYQHDVNQTMLRQKLDDVVVSVVNRVGVDINTASRHLLKYVSGIGSTVAENIVAYREENGVFKNRNDFLKIRMFGNKAFTQSAGFLRIRGGDNPLDNTGIHPETYKIVDMIGAKLDVSVRDLLDKSSLLDNLKYDDFTIEEFGRITFDDVVRELKNPRRDPRSDFKPFEFMKGVNSIEDLSKDMILNGIVTNVVNFGAFVDIGVHQDGLVHVSALSHTFVQDPSKIVAAGDHVKVKVVDVDVPLKRIQLSMKDLQEVPAGSPVNKKNKKIRKKKINSVRRKGDSVESLMAKWGKVK